MKKLLQPLLIIILAGTASAAQPLPRSTPEAQGVSSAAVQEFVSALGALNGVHAVMIMRHGQVITEGWWAPYDPDHRHILFSLSKSFTSTAVGLAISEGKFSLDDQVIKFFPDDAPTNPSVNLKSMRVRDLLIMSTGHEDEPSSAADIVSAKNFLAQPVPHIPGTHFKYNTAATFMLAAIIQQTTGQTVLDYLRPRIFEPLGIEQPLWGTNFQGIPLAGSGMRARTEDILKLGQLYLQHGNFQGQQLIPSNWVAQATTRQTSNGSDPKNDWNQGYGYHFWRCQHGAYRGDGAGGQFIVVMQDQDTVVAINSGLQDMQSVLNVIWDKLFPALQSSQALPPNPDGDKQLRDQLAHLQINPAQGAATSSLAGKILNRKFVFPANDKNLESLTLATPDATKTLTLTLQINGKEIAIPCGYNEWKKGQAALFLGKKNQFPDVPAAGTFAWPADDICAIKLNTFETLFPTLLTLKFNGDEVTLDADSSVPSKTSKWSQLTGLAK
jgi:CubicO group peptidase (beta-lactamase class C family)